MKKFAYVLIGLLIVLIAAVLIGPSFIDWNAYKGRIVAAIEDNIGRATAIDGNISFSVLPAPALRVAGVRIANFDGARTADMLRLKELRLRLSIGALIGGRVAIEKLELIEPVIALETGKDGTSSWDIEWAATDSGSPRQSEGETEDSAPIDVSLAGVIIRNGAMSYSAPGANMSETIDGLNVTASAPSLSGPFDIAAEARYRNIPFSLALKSGSVKPGQPIGFTLKVALIEAAASMEFAGRVTAPGRDALVSGNIKLTGDSAARLVALTTKAALPESLRQAISLEGTVMVSGQAVALNDTRFQLGETTGNGAVSITLGEVIGADVAMSVNRLDLDALIAVAASSGSGKPPGAASAAATPSAAAGFSLPTNVAATLDLAVEAIQYRGGVIRQAGLRGALANGAITLDRASALLPGGSDISLVGFLQAVDGAPQFEGEIAAASDNLRGVMQWLGVDITALRADRLRGFSLASKLTATPDAVQIPDINLRLDASTATGGLAIALRDRPGFGLRLDIDRLNLDAYLPKPGTEARRGKPARASDKGAAGSPSSPPGSGHPLAFLDTFDANIDARIGSLTVRRATARNVVFLGQLVGSALSVEKLHVDDFAGARVDLAGSIKEFTSEPIVAAGFDIVVNKPDRLSRFLDLPMPLPAEKLGNPSFKGRIDGTAAEFKLDTTIVAAGSTVRFAGDVGLSTALSINAGMTVKHPEFTKFVQLFSPDFNPAAAELGPLDTSFTLQGEPAHLKISALRLTAGPVQVQGDVAVRSDGPRPALTANLTTSEVLLDLFQPAPQPTDSATARGRLRAVSNGAGGTNGERWSRETLDLSVMQTLDADVTVTMSGLIKDRIHLANPRISAVLKSGQLNVNQFQAGIFGGSVNVSGLLDARTATPKVNATVSAKNLDMVAIAKTFTDTVRVSGPVSVDASLVSAGGSEAALIDGLNGQGSLSGKARLLATKEENQVLGTLGLASALFGNKVKELRQVGGLSSVLVKAFGAAPADLSGTFAIQRGVVSTDDTTLSGAGARALNNGTIDLPRWLINMTTSVLRSGDRVENPYVTLRLTGALDDPGIKAGGSFLGSSAAAPASPVQQLLPSVLGNKNDNQERKVQPTDIIRGLLKGLAK